MISEITLSLTDEPGELKRVLEILYDVNINVQAFCVERCKEYSDLRLVCDDMDLAIQEFKNKGYKVTISEVFAVRLAHAPGSLLKIASLFGENGINVEYGYLTLVPKTNMAIVLISVDKKMADKAKELLEENDFGDLDKIPVIEGR